MFVDAIITYNEWNFYIFFSLFYNLGSYHFPEEDNFWTSPVNDKISVGPKS